MQYLADRITISPDICHGKPTVRGTRVMVQTILEFLAAGDSEADILWQYPDLESADLKACLRFAAELLDRHIVFKSVA